MARRRRLRGVKPSDVLTAQSEAKVRYGPERSAISALLGEAKGQYEADVQAAKAGARSAVLAAKRARKPLRQIYTEATGIADTAAQDVERAFGTLGAAADPFRAATTREMATERTRIAGAAAGAQRELRQRRLEAQVGRQFAVQKARTDYAANVSKLAQRLQDLGSEQGSYIAGRLGTLRSERAQRRQGLRVARIQQRGAERLAGVKHKQELEQIEAREQAKARYGDVGGVGGGKPASRSELRMFKSDFGKALQWAKDYARGGDARSKAASELSRGAETPTGQANVPAIDDQLALSVALDMAYDGHVSRNNARALHEAGLRVSDVPGAVGYGQWSKRRSRVRRGAPTPAGFSGGTY